jgi:3-keto-5-aminohexanoate cleavage enzyme
VCQSITPSWRGEQGELVTVRDQAVWAFGDSQAWMARARDGFAPMMITCAVNGGLQGREANAALPETPEEIAAQAGEAYDAGAVIVHVHARDPEDLASCARAADVFAEVNERIRDRCPEIIINNTTGGGPGVTMEDRLDCLEAQPEMASLNLGPEMSRYTLAPRPEPIPHPHEGYVYDDTIPFTYGSIEALAERMKQLGIRPELETYQPGHFWVSRALIEGGFIDPPYAHQFVMGFQTSSYPTVENVAALTRELPEGSIYFVCGVGVFQLPMTALSTLMGGHVRVGLEDNLYYSRGRKLRGNGEAVERAVRIARELNREVATCAQAREMLGLSEVPRREFAGVAK